MRRPSHEDKRRAWRRALLGEEIRAALRPGVTAEEIQATAERPVGTADCHLPSNQPGGISSDQTSLLSGWAWPPATQILSRKT